jgi:hypothetical protein
MNRFVRIVQILALLLLFPHGAPAQNAPVDPAALPAKDSHNNLLIAADPFLDADRYKEAFGKSSPYGAGIMAIQVYFRNDNDAPIRLNLDTIRLIVSLPDVQRQRLAPLSPEEVTDRTLLTANANPKARAPFPFPAASNGEKKSKAWVEMDTLLRSVAVSSDILPPRATTHGFLFFDMNHDFDAIRHTHLYIPDLAFMTSNQALFYFEIDLGAAPKK